MVETGDLIAVVEQSAGERRTAVRTTILDGEQAIVVGAKYRDVDIARLEYPRALAGHFFKLAYCAPLAHKSHILRGVRNRRQHGAATMHVRIESLASPHKHKQEIMQ